MVGIYASAATFTVIEEQPLDYVNVKISVGDDQEHPDVYVRGAVGILRLTVDGTAMNGFCVDPFHISLDSSPGYEYVPLPDAPKEHQVGPDTALLISRLWGRYYSPTMSATGAAGLQIAIWELVGGSAFVLPDGEDYDADIMLASVRDSNYAGPVADLVGLTGPGQDYVVQKVGDGGSTLALLGLALCGLSFATKKFAWV